MRPLRPAGCASAAACAAALVACGSTPVAELPPPAAPAPAPPPATRPAGVVVSLPAPARALAVDAAGRVAAGRVVLAGRAARPRVVGGAAPAVPAPDRAAGDEGFVAVVDARARQLVLRDAAGREVDRRPAGVGPRRVVSDGRRRWYVTDTGGEALLLFERRPEGLRLVRRVHLPGSPFALAIERKVAYRVWVALVGRNELVGLPAHGRPHPVERLPTVRRPLAVAADRVTGRVFVAGEDPRLQAIPPP